MSRHNRQVSTGRATRVAAAIVGATVLAVAGAGLAGSASAEPAASVPPAATATVASTQPALPVCHPVAGTVIRSKATSEHTAWQPTSASSSWLAGPGTISESRSETSTASVQLSANFSVDEGLLFVSAKEQYGIALTKSSAHTQTWTYQTDIPAHVTARDVVYHEGGELGIKQTRESYVRHDGRTGCGTTSETSLSGNFFPYKSTGASSYCIAPTTSAHPAVQVRARCKSTD